MLPRHLSDKSPLLTDNIILVPGNTPPVGARRILKIFERNIDGIRPVFNNSKKLQTDEHFKDHILYYEYFHGGTGKGLGASHQKGWTTMITSDIFNFGVDK